MKNVSLHGNLGKKVYINVALGFVHKSWSNKVNKLKKALYKLKKSPCAWFRRFTISMVKKGYIKTKVIIPCSLNTPSIEG